MTPKQALTFVREHGIVLESARGSVPSLAEAVAGGPIRGGWWGHPKGHAIFSLTREVRDSKDILVCRLVGGKITYVHRRLWPALFRLAKELGRARLDAVREIHTASGAHRTVVTRFPKWVPAATHAAAKRMTEEEARAALPAGIVTSKRG